MQRYVLQIGAAREFAAVSAAETIEGVNEFDTFLIVADYYLDRSRDVIERDMASDILHQDFEEFSTKNDQTR